MTTKEEARSGEDREIELSVVIPCLNESDTLASCIRKAKQAFENEGIVGEVIVSDNGSTDASATIAAEMGARVIDVPQKGYGNALMGGIEAAQGKYVIMGDADDSYDFLAISGFVEKLREGSDLVQGCRLPSGGGTVLPGAMPFTHRWFGNPFFSCLARWWFKVPIHDINCGLRGFSKAHYDHLALRCTGMEFANEMVIKSSLMKSNIAEVPVILAPDGRIAHEPHLRTIRDGWRTLRFYLLYCPEWLFVVPGILLILIGLLAYAVAMPRLEISGITFDVHTLLCASLMIICGFQALIFGLFAKVFAIGEGLMPESENIDRFFRLLNLERGLILGIGLLLVGILLILYAVAAWKEVGFGELDYVRTMRWVIPGVTLSVLGFQSVLSGFLLGILRLGRRIN